jgi:hypothetical protein
MEYIEVKQDLGILFNLKREAIYSSEIPVDFHQTTQRYIPEHFIE